MEEIRPIWKVYFPFTVESENHSWNAYQVFYYLHVTVFFSRTCKKEKTQARQDHKVDGFLYVQYHLHSIIKMQIQWCLTLHLTSSITWMISLLLTHYFLISARNITSICPNECKQKLLQFIQHLSVFFSNIKQTEPNC